MFNFDYLNKEGYECNGYQYKDPHGLIQHLQLHKTGCSFHKIVLKYLQNMYSTFWEEEKPAGNLSSAHYGLYNKNSKDYHLAMLTWDDVACESNILFNVDKHPPKLTFDKSKMCQIIQHTVEKKKTATKVNPTPKVVQT